MKNPRFSEYQVVTAFKRDKTTREAAENLFSMLKEFSYSLHAVRYNCVFSAVMKVKTRDELGRDEILEKHIMIKTKETIIPEYCEFNKEYFYTLLFKRIESLWNPQELRYYGRRIVNIEFEKVYCHVDKESLIIWLENEVGTYHVEQECGQGWIMLPLSPMIQFCGYTDFTEQNT